MGEESASESGLLLISSFSRYPDAIEWARVSIDLFWGPVALQSPPFSFGETRYYEPTMGTDLHLRIFCAAEPLAPDLLADIKIWTNRLEEIYSETSPHPEIRPLNLDPGLLTPAKFLLATTKNASHRIHLHSGIFAEVTLAYEHGRWQEQKWTYPNYRRDDYQSFLEECRQYLMHNR